MNNKTQYQQTRLLLVDDHKIMREGLASLITNEFHMEVVDQAETGRQAIALTEQHTPDIVLMDVSMPDMNGIEATRLILDKFPKTKIIALSMHADKRFIMEMMNVGAAGYLLKHAASDELEWAIKEVMKGHTFISPAITGIVIQEYREVKHRERTASDSVSLSAREREVLQLIAEGKTAKEISALLMLSVKTTETHRTNIMTKLGLYSIAELTKYAIREGITSLDS